MGCASSNTVELRRILPLPPETVNSFIDKFPAIVLQKIKEKFEAVADKKTKSLDQVAFLKLFAHAEMSEEAILRLFYFFNDHQQDTLKFRRFMVKYAIITKSEPQLLFKIFFEIYKDKIESRTMSRQECLHCLSIHRQFYENKELQVPLDLLSQLQFLELMGRSNFDEKKYQKRLTITTEDDIPFQAISREIQDCDFNGMTSGQHYHLLSNAWFNRWSFYYLEVDHTNDRSHIKSTKLLLDNNKKRTRKVSIKQTRQRNSSNLRTSQLGNSLIQQPNTIDFDEIEGEYRGQLKDQLQTNAQIRIVSENLWKLLCTLHQPQQDFKRKAIDQDTIEYYPKTVFYCQTDKKGAYILASQTLVNLSLSQSVGKLYQKDRSQLEDFGVFTKNFSEKNWREIQITKKGADISLDPRFFIAFAHNRQKFLKEHHRSEISLQTLDLGDKVFAYFPYIKDYAEGIIIQIGQNENFKVHFKGYSYRYELFINRNELTLDEADRNRPVSRRKKDYLIRGISNIGNTCFMNSIIQCLVATPVLDSFLQEYPFDQTKNPIGYGLSAIAKSLLKNEKPSPFEFKKLIDVHMPLFSGYNQHDAQQFLNILLDTVSAELKEKPTVIDYLFGGKAQAQLTCHSCQNIKRNDETMYILSLPLPQAQFNYYSIIVVPITSKTIKKIIFKLHKNATVIEYINAFEEKTGELHPNFVFCETNNNALKSLKTELTSPTYQKKKITDVGVVPNISLIAFEKTPTRFYYELLKRKEAQGGFKDFQTPAQAYWTVCRASNQQADKHDKITIEYINQENEVQTVKINKRDFQTSTAKLGTQTSDPYYKKIILRKYNSSLKKLEHFGLQFLIGIPKWASYNDIIALIERYIQNIKAKDAKLVSMKLEGDYMIRLLDPVKVRCIFCLKDSKYFGLSQSDLDYCCSAFDKNVPLGWVQKHRSFWIYVDWINFSACNSSFCSYIEVDALSRKVEESRQEDYINLQDCIKLHHQSEKVEMECDKCKGKYQDLEHLIGTMPNILIVHMKEFRYTAEGHLIKLDLRLKWKEFLDSSKFAVTSQGKLYELYALVRHAGNSQSGHYTCMTKRKHPFENKKVWVNFDDDVTEIVKQEQKFIDDAYLLFYKKVDMPTSSLVIYSDLSSP